MMLSIPIHPMQHPQSLTHSCELHVQRMTTSLVIPQAMASQQQPCSPQRSSGRPKLSLNINTTRPRTFGKGGSSSLRLDTLSAVSPTLVNTFQNTNPPEVQKPTPATAIRDTTEPQTAIQIAQPQKPARPKLSIDSSVYSAPSMVLSTPDLQDTRTPSCSSLSSASTSNSATIPYQITHSLHSALVNSPILRMPGRGRPRFPAEKKVSFKDPLIEEIHNEKYTRRHSDILDSPESASTLSLSTDSISTDSISTDLSSTESVASEHTSTPSDSSDPSVSLPNSHSESESQSTDTSSTEPPVAPQTSLRIPHRLTRTRLKIKSPKLGDKRDSSSESDSDTCPETPVAGRRKRQRDWVWTLGDLPGATPANTTSAEKSSTSTSSASSTCTTTNLSTASDSS